MRKLLEWLSAAIVRIFFREINIEEAENLPESGPVIFTPNHPNALLDPLLMQSLLKKFRVRFVAKAELFKIPVFGSILRSLGAIPVTRRMDVKNADVDYSEFFNSCVAALKEGDSIAIFPEGRSLPQPFLAPLRTGPARLFFLAREKSIPVRIVPVGLNYERGSLFRSAVLLSLAPPIDTTQHEAEYTKDPSTAVRHLTNDLANSLDERVFQAETYRDRELILLLERLYSTDEDRASSWADRLERLRIFEDAIDDLHHTHSKQLDRIRHLLARYQRISTTFHVDAVGSSKPKRSTGIFVMGLEFLVASVGWILNILPYLLTDQIVRMTRKDESEAATFKIVWGLILFPLAYILEGIILYRFLGGLAVILFAIAIVPLTLFTLRFFEWRDEIGGSLTEASAGMGTPARVTTNLHRLKERIVNEVDLLAAEREKLRG